MFRATALVALFVSVALATPPVRADGPEDRTARLQRRLEEVLARESRALREELRSLVEEELENLGGDRREERTDGGGTAEITAAELLAHVRRLASDEFEGRGTKQPGVWKAARWLAGEFRRIGLEPAAGDGYFQRFTVGDAEAANVAGLVRGTDPRLRDEVVIVGAHYDHLGQGSGMDAGRLDQILGERTEGDLVYNGADDNASGTAAVLEAAEALAAAPPRRSVLFLLFAGEELGLLGSAHYARHPLFPLARTAAMINLDMVGRNPRRPLDVIASDSAREVRRAFEEAARETGVRVRFTGQGLMGGSDHQSFYPKRVPVAHLFSGLHRDYHRASDEVERISPEQMERAARLTAAAAARIADLPKKPRFRRVPSMDLADFLQKLLGGGEEE